MMSNSIQYTSTSNKIVNLYKVYLKKRRYEIDFHVICYNKPALKSDIWLMYVFHKILLVSPMH